MWLKGKKMNEGDRVKEHFSTVSDSIAHILYLYNIIHFSVTCNRIWDVRKKPQNALYNDGHAD